MGSRLEKNSSQVRKRIAAHTFDDELGDEYEGSKFGGFPEYFRRKKIKLQNLDAQLRSESKDKPQIFKGIVAQVNGYTQPSLNDLHQLIVSHGGGFMQYLDGKTSVTHIIAANLTPKKAIEFRKYRVVKPAWVVDSVAAGRILPWEGYRVLDEGINQRLIGFNGGKLVSQANAPRVGYREQSDTSCYASQIKNSAARSSGRLVSQVSPKPVIDEDVDLQSSDEANVYPIDRGNPAVGDNLTVQSNSINDEVEITSSLEQILDTAKGGNIAKDPTHILENVHTPDLELSAILPDVKTPVKPTADEADIFDLPSSPKTPSPRPQPQEYKIAEDASPSKVPTSMPVVENEVTTSNEEKATTNDAKQPNAMTAEEHNAMLLTDPHIRKSTTANPEFLQQYYRESRLHHLSAWKADLKARLQQIASEKSASQRQTTKRKPGSRRYIMHVDFDSFFCAVSLKKAPEFKDKPAVVAHGSGNGSEIASCNYPARAFGVKNGMWMKNALPLCPDLKVLPYDFPAYEEASRGFYEAILDLGGLVQSVSVDEALVDISTLVCEQGANDPRRDESAIRAEQDQADELASILRAKIRLKTGCDVSIGIGRNILLAKVALRKAKPAGQHQIKPEDVLDFIGELKLPDLPGVASSIGGKLAEVGVNLVKDVRSLSKDRLMTILGPKTGEKIWEYSKGIDKTEVGEQTIRKSVSAEVNWGIRFISQPEAEEFVQNLCGELQKRLLDAGVKGKQITFKIMRRSADAPMDPPKNLGHGKCDTFNKSVVLGVATNSAEIIGKETVSILRGYGFSPGELRGLGVQMTKLEPIRPSDSAHGSQKRITFGRSAIGGQAPVPPKLPKKAEAESIEEFDSPVKPKTPAEHPAMAITRSNEADHSSKKSLNLMGTQFIMPTQVDPKVLAELPMDIRSRLMAQHKAKASIRSASPATRSPSSSPTKAAMEASFIPSQYDPDVFNNLPAEMRAELLAEARANKPGLQSVLPQSPRKVRTIVLSKKPLTPTKAKRGRAFGARGKGHHDDNSPYLQSNFASKMHAAYSGTTVDSAQDSEEEPDAEFLSALPEELRQDVLADYKRRRLHRKSGLVTVAPKRRHNAASRHGPQKKSLNLPPRPPRPTFTTAKLSTLPELRDMVSTWHDEFKDEGPLPEDLRALERYLRRVVMEERNLEKVVGLCKWLEWVVGDSGGAADGIRAWEAAVGQLKERVREAGREIGLTYLVME